MKFALLGYDSSLEPLLSSLAADRHELVAWYDVPQSDQSRLTGWFPKGTAGGEWDELLTLGRDTTILVARGHQEDQRTEQLRKLIQAGQPLVVAHPVVDAMVVFFELDMIRRDGGGILVPWVGERWHPGFNRIEELIDDGLIGKIEQIMVERTVIERRPREVLRQFSRDIHLVRGWIGELTKVGALAGSKEDFGSLGVQMSGPSGTLIRWSALSGSHLSSAKLTFVDTTGKAVVDIGDGETPWRLEIHRGGQVDVEMIPTAKSLAAELVEHLTLLQAGESNPPTWLDACRDAELADAVDRSAAKGKTIELYLEEVDEHSTFKGMMAAGGCLLLLIILPVLVLATTLVNLNVPLAGLWPYVLLIVLGGFLLLQLLKLVFPREEPR